MEENKTKKMTKAEAFEYLNGKKVRTKGNHEKVLRKLFDLGFVCKCTRDTRVDLDWQLCEVYGLTISNDEVAWWYNPYLFETYFADAVTADDILSIEIVNDKQCKKEDAFYLISTIGARLSEVLRRMGGHKHVVITEGGVILYDKGVSLFHSDQF